MCAVSGTETTPDDAIRSSYSVYGGSAQRTTKAFEATNRKFDEEEHCTSKTKTARKRDKHHVGKGGQRREHNRA